MVLFRKKCPGGLLEERFPHFKDFSTKIYLVIHGFYNSRFFPSPKKRELQGPPVFQFFSHFFCCVVLLLKAIKLNANGKILSPSIFDHHRKWLLAQIMPTHALEFPINRLGQTHPGPPGSYSSEFEPKITHFLWWSKLEGLRISVRVKFYNL